MFCYDGQILLGRDSLSVFIGFDGKPRRKLGLSWTDVPMVCAVCIMYTDECMDAYKNASTVSLSTLL